MTSSIRMTRRAALMATGAMLLAACSPAAQPAPTAAPAKPAAAPTAAPAAKGDAAKPAARGNLRTLSVGILPSVDFLGLYVAIEKGYFAEEGLQPELRAMAGGAEIVPALVGGSLDLGITNTFSHLLAKEGNLDLRALAGGSVQTKERPTHAILVKGDSPIQSARDMEGKNFGINTLNNIDHIMVQEWLEKNGADPKKVNFVEIPFPQHPAALAQGRIDISAPTAPFTTIILAQGGKSLARHYVEVVDRVLVAYYVATNDWLQKPGNADVARKFVAAIDKGNKLVTENEKEARSIAAAQLKLDPSVAEKMDLPLQVTKIDPALIKWWLDVGMKRGMLKQATDPATLLYETAR